jgi:hypothetical protein
MRAIGRLLRRAIPIALLLLAASFVLVMAGFAGAHLLGYLAAGLGIAGGIAAALLPAIHVEEDEGGWLSALIDGFSGDGSDSGSDSGGGEGD